jgi:hypothetical protein
MPTFERTPRFIRHYQRLTPEERQLFKAAVADFVRDLRTGGEFRPSLRVKRFRRIPGMWEMSWGVDGRALFRYGPAKRPGEPHVVWHRVGSHDIFDEPVSPEERRA